MEKIKFEIVYFGTQTDCSSISGKESFEFDGTENDLMRVIGKYTYDIFTNNENIKKINFRAVLSDSNAFSFSYAKRGNWTDKKGLKHSSMHITSTDYNSCYPLSKNKGKYKPRDLRCINSFGNNYKKYLIDVEGNDLVARYGSIDVPADLCKTVHYDSYMYWLLYYEKLSHGYVDMSGVLKDTVLVTNDNVNMSSDKSPENANEELYKLLYNFSKDVVETNLVNEVVTRRQTEKARTVFDELKTKKTVKGFNTCLQKLMIISPRKRNPLAGDTVSQYLATDKSDFGDIIEFEETLILSMETLVSDKDIKEKRNEENNLPSFKALNIDVFEANETQVEEVKKYLGSYASRIKKVYRIKPLEQEKRFSKYCKENNITTFKKFWHGSVNANWFSIVENSLTIPKRATNGRMFGDGIYFAPSADKSFGYTSYYGSRWANGRSNLAIMGLYTTAYGNPYNPQGYGSQRLNKESLKTKGYDCCHAKSTDTGLRADEVIFYDTNAVVLNYIVLFN